MREALFSALEARGLLDGAAVLDLYAGSGALGLEAASRGARRVTLVERAGAAARVCRANAGLLEQALRRQGSAVPDLWVQQRPVADFLTQRPGDTPIWDLVFADPPYALPLPEVHRMLALVSGQVTGHAHILVERRRQGGATQWPSDYRVLRRSDHGDTCVWWLRPVDTEA